MADACLRFFACVVSSFGNKNTPDGAASAKENVVKQTPFTKWSLVLSKSNTQPENTVELKEWRNHGPRTIKIVRLVGLRQSAVWDFALHNLAESSSASPAKKTKLDSDQDMMSKETVELYFGSIPS